MGARKKNGPKDAMEWVAKVEATQEYLIGCPACLQEIAVGADMRHNAEYAWTPEHMLHAVDTGVWICVGSGEPAKIRGYREKETS